MHRLFLLTVLINFFTLLPAQDVKFSASAPRVVRAGEQFQLTYSISEKPDEIKLPDLQHFQLLGGPSTGHSSSMQIINGKVTKSSTYTYTYYLRATDEGKYNIEPATITYKRKTYKSNSVPVEVVGQSTRGSSPQQEGDKQESAGLSDEDLFVRLHLDKRSAFVGEQISAWIKLYTRVQVVNYDRQFKGPDYTGFLKQDIDIPQLTSLQRENVNGEIYNTGILRRVILTPQKPGEITINPFELVVAVQQQVRSRSRSRSLFDEFFDSPFRNVQVVLESRPVTINVKSLPVNKPSGFQGGVGKFRINTEVSSTSVKTNDAITMKITLSGRGNLYLVDKLDIKFPPALEVFDPVVRSDIRNTANGSTGTKTFEYTIIARHPGDFTIAPVSFSYFDIEKQGYITVKSPEYNIHIERGEGDTGSVITGISKKEYEMLESDIRYIKNGPVKFESRGEYLHGSRLFYLFYMVAVFIFAGIVIFTRTHIKRNADLVRVKNRKANKQAVRRLKKAAGLMKGGKEEQFYEEVVKALWGYLAGKLNIPIADLSRDNASRQLKKRGIEGGISEELFGLLDKCEYARFAPGDKAEFLGDIYRKSIRTITKIEQSLK